MSWPRHTTFPDVGRSNDMINFASVDLPQPDSPTTPSVSPLCRVKLTPSTARTAPICRRKTMPCVSGKCLTRSRASRMGSPCVGTGHRSLLDLGLGVLAQNGVVGVVLGGRQVEGADEDFLPVVAGASAVRGDRVERGDLLDAWARAGEGAARVERAS